MCGKKTDQGVNDDSVMEFWRLKSVAHGYVWSDQVLPILFKDIREQTQDTYRKYTLLPRNIFGLFRDRGGKSFDDKIPTKVPKQVYIIFERDIGHTRGVPSVTNKSRRRGGVLRGRTGWDVPQLGIKVDVYDITIQ